MLNEDRFYIITLYDYYESLLTDKQQEYFKMYFFNDLSLAEIADEFKVSRAAIQDSIKKIIKDLKYYEDNLQLYINAKRRLALYEQIDNAALKAKLFSLEQRGKANEK